MDRNAAALTISVRSKAGPAHKVRYSPAQLERMKEARELWERLRSFPEVGAALGVSRKRARQLVDRGAALGLYRPRRGASASTVHPEETGSKTMPSLGKILGSEIQRLARRAARPLVEDLRRDLRRQHRLVAALRAEVESLSKDRRTLMDDLRRRLAQPQPADAAELERAHLGPKLIVAQRKRLGFNKTEFARLVGVAVPTLSGWEEGRRKPRSRARASLVAARHLGRRQARLRLDALERARPRRPPAVGVNAR